MSDTQAPHLEVRTTVEKRDHTFDPPRLVERVHSTIHADGHVTTEVEIVDHDTLTELEKLGEG